MARDCVKRIVEKANGAISKQEAQELLDIVDRTAKRKVRAGFDYDDSVKDILAERIKNTETNLKKQRENTLRNIAIKTKNIDKGRGLIDSGLNIIDAIRADLEGINSAKAGTRNSLDTAKSAVESTYLSKLIGDLNKGDLLQILNSKKFDKEIGRQLWALSAGEGNTTNNKQVQQIARIIYDVREGQRVRLNKAGADIGQVAGYVMPQRHDVFDMAKAGEDEWLNFIRPLVDESRTFNGDYDNLDDALRSAYRAMVTGIRLNELLVKNEKLFQFSGPANLGKKLSQAREIHFKDFDSWQKWNERFGSKDLNEGVLDAVRFDSNNIALIERYGTNPEAMLKEVTNALKRDYRDTAAAKGEQGIDSKVQSLIDAALDKNLIPANPSVARIGSNIRMFNNVTMLGGALISSITDIPMKALEYRFQGKSWLGATLQPFLDVGQGFKSKAERVNWSSLMGVFGESIVGDIGGRFSTQDTLTSKAAKVQRMFFKLNGLEWWTDTHKNAMGRMMAHDLGLKRNISYSKLDADTKRLFGNYGITEKDWDIMRQHSIQMDDGRYYILADNINDVAVSEKLRGYMIDRVNYGVISPGAREQRLTSFGTQRGTAIGEATRLVMQFKSFPLTAITKVWGRALYGKGKADVPAMAYLMLMTAVFGYIAGATKDIIKGRTPKDLNEPETFFASLAQGGGLGILGDLLFTETGFGKGVTQVLAGPTFGRLDELHKLYSANVRGEGTAAQATKTAISLIPGNNIFYARAALDQILLYQMMEDLNPGYMQRMERNMQKTYGQELLFK